MRTLRLRNREIVPSPHALRCGPIKLSLVKRFCAARRTRSPCPTTRSATCFASPPGARATGRRSAASSTAARRALRSTAEDIQVFLDKRRPGQSRFTTQRREPDAVRILSGVFTDDAGRQVTTGTPISLVIDNVDQRGKDYADIKDKFRPGHADFTYLEKYGIRDYRGGGRSSARETAMRVAAGRGRAQGDPRRHDPRRAGADRPAQDRPRALELGRGRQQPLLLARRRHRRHLVGLSRRGAQGRLLGRRRDRGGGRGRAGRLGRADLRQARPGPGRRHDEHQRGQGRRDRRRHGRGRADRRGQRRRDPHRQRRPAAVPLQQRRRHPRRHLVGPARSSCALPSSRPRRS